MAKTLPTQSDGHLLIAAVRVILHQTGIPPRPEEVAELLKWGNEKTYVIVRGLVGRDILRMHEMPFEVRLEIADHLQLEDLPVEEDQEALQDVMDEFRRADKSRKEQMEKLFETGDLDRHKKDKATALEKEFAEFRKKKPRPSQ